MKYKKRQVKVKKSDIIVPDIDDEEDEEDEEMPSNIFVTKKVNRMLKKIQDDWVRNYIIN